MSRDTGWRERLKARASVSIRAPAPTKEQISKIIVKHALDASPDEVLPVPAIGTVNTVVALGERYVLRVPGPHGVGDTRTESVAAPAALAAGLMTPALIVFDESLEVFDVPFTVYERVHGENFGCSDLSLAKSKGIYREIGRQLAILHERVEECSDPHGYLDTPSRTDPDDLLEYLGEESYLSSYNVHWLERVFERLRPSVEEGRQYRRFLHNDVLPTNVMVRGGVFAALIDWNDSGWGDPALEFSALPARSLPEVLLGYREVGPIDGDSTVAHRILWDHLCAALEFLLCTPDQKSISWARPPFARLTELFAAAAHYDPWRDVLK